MYTQVIEPGGLAAVITGWKVKYNEDSLSLPAANKILRGEKEDQGDQVGIAILYFTLRFIF
jgi:hypothetical protein